MGAIIRYSLNLDKLDKSKVVKGKKGTYDFLPKPFEMDELLESIRNILK